MISRARPLVTFPLLVLLLLAVLGWALSSGAFGTRPVDVFRMLVFNEGDSLALRVVWELRLPRVVACFACGGLLALSGGLMQVMLRNPLADPYILGVSGGAAVGWLGASFFGLAMGSVGMYAGALGGALLVMLLVFGLAHGDGSWTQTRLLLTGVIVASGCGALITLILALAPANLVQPMLFWLMGDTGYSTHPWVTLGVLGAGLVVVLPLGRELNVLARGQMSAQALGVDVRRLGVGLYFLASIFTATAVTQVGTVGFVGLIVPHLVRLLVGNDQRVLLPVAGLSGGGILVAADTLSRTVLSQQLPVGVMTALIGVPVFLVLLARHSK